MKSLAAFAFRAFAFRARGLAGTGEAVLLPGEAVYARIRSRPAN